MKAREVVEGVGGVIVASAILIILVPLMIVEFVKFCIDPQKYKDDLMYLDENLRLYDEMR